MITILEPDKFQDKLYQMQLYLVKALLDQSKSKEKSLSSDQPSENKKQVI